jgi:hypothetical protein
MFMPSVNDALVMWSRSLPLWLQGVSEADWEHDSSKIGNPWDVRAMPRVTLGELVEWYMAHMEDGGDYGPARVEHPWLLTPSGQLPRGSRAASSWWAIRCLGLEKVPPSDRLYGFTSDCAVRLLFAWSEMTGEPGPVLEGLDEEGQEAYEGMNAKTIGQMVRELRRQSPRD